MDIGRKRSTPLAIRLVSWQTQTSRERTTAGTSVGKTPTWRCWSWFATGRLWQKAGKTTIRRPGASYSTLAAMRERTASPSTTSERHLGKRVGSKQTSTLEYMG